MCGGVSRRCGVADGGASEAVTSAFSQERKLVASAVARAEGSIGAPVTSDGAASAAPCDQPACRESTSLGVRRRAARV